MKQIFKIFSVLILLGILNATLTAQNETKIWYFGSYAGLDFSTNPPSILLNSGMNANEGCASISDISGNLLFYTDGMTIWDKTHNPMANGGGLFGGGGSTSQAALIIKQPGNSSLYYVFTNEAQNGSNYGLHYSIVDMNLASGNGSVTVKNTFLFASTTEKLCATKHANGIDVWVMTHDFNSNNFRTYLLSAAGINTVAVISSIGTVHGPTLANIVGYMKISPEGKKIGLALYSTTNTGVFELYDFNNSNAQVSNPVILGNNFSEPYGVEFSPDGTKFYGGEETYGFIHQWNLCVATNSDIIASHYAVSTSTLNGIGALQMGVNGKIYAARIGDQTLGVINNPNVSGLSCNYVEFGQSVAPKVCGYGLPNFMSSYFWPGPTLTVTPIGSSSNFSLCLGETKTLSVSGANTYTWNLTTVSPTLAISPTATNSYSVIGTTTAGCKFDAVITVSVNACTNISELSSDDFIKVYPNPVSDFLVIDAKYKSYKVLLYNNMNDLILSTSLENGRQKINVDFLPTGIYYLKLENETMNKTFKLIKA